MDRFKQSPHLGRPRETESSIILHEGTADGAVSGLELGIIRIGHYQPYTFDCNWKLAVENFFDNYHVFNVHPALSGMQSVGETLMPARMAGGARLLDDVGQSRSLLARQLFTMG